MNLQVLDELYALFTSDDTVADTTQDDEAAIETDEACCCLSSDDSERAGAKTLQLFGTFLGKPVLILVDSGSSTSFISHPSAISVSCHYDTVSDSICQSGQCTYYAVFSVFASSSMEYPSISVYS